MVKNSENPLFCVTNRSYRKENRTDAESGEDVRIREIR